MHFFFKNKYESVNFGRNADGNPKKVLIIFKFETIYFVKLCKCQYCQSFCSLLANFCILKALIRK